MDIFSEIGQRAKNFFDQYVAESLGHLGKGKVKISLSTFAPTKQLRRLNIEVKGAMLQLLRTVDGHFNRGYQPANLKNYLLCEKFNFPLSKTVSIETDDYTIEMSMVGEEPTTPQFSE